MENYKTVEEKAAEWKISSRHIQYLCRNGKIENAIKRAGSWFIPEEVPNPAKHSKSNLGDFHFAGTKKRIFHSAIELFVSNGVDNVSLKDIASRMGVRQSTIYNHFKSKQGILDTIYDFYCHHYYKDRPALDDMEIKLQDAPLMDIIRSIRYDFHEDYQQTMSHISKIILQRMTIDPRANEIAKSLMVDEGIQYVEGIFNRGIECGRFAPFDTHAMAVFIKSVRMFTFYHWMIDPSAEEWMKISEDEHALYQYAGRFIQDLRPSLKS